jgi:hypothetical protein
VAASSTVSNFEQIIGIASSHNYFVAYLASCGLI